MRPLAVLLMLLATAPLHAQPVTEIATPDQSIVADLGTMELFDSLRAWPVDVNKDGVPDRLVQGAFLLGAGGNGTYTRHFLYVAQTGGFVRVSEMEIGDPIESVALTSQGPLLTLYVYQGSDPRCCPSGRRQLLLNI